MYKFILSAFADEYSDSIVEQCKALNAFGFSHIELRHANGKNVSETTSSEIKEIKAVLYDYNVKVSSIGSPIGKIKISDDFNKHLDLSKRIFDTASELNSKYVRIFSFYPDDKDNLTESLVFERLNLLVELSEQYNITLCHENEAKIYGESPENCLKLLEAFKSKLKCVFDMGNFVLDGFDPITAYNLLYPHVAYFHIKDALKAGAIVPPGKGEAKIKEILSHYKTNANSDTFITLEPHLQTFAGLNALVGKTFENPYKYESQQLAFADAVSKLKEII